MTQIMKVMFNFERHPNSPQELLMMVMILMLIMMLIMMFVVESIRM